MPVEIKRSSIEDIPQIKALQVANLSRLLPDEEKAREGFVTAEYTIDFLQTLHSIEPSIVAKDGDEVVGYALVVTKEIYGQHALLDHLFDAVDLLTYNDVPLKSESYCIVGQLCVSKSHRGQGLVERMYSLFRDSLRDKFRFVVTEVALDNPRSLRAHEKVGFKLIHQTSFNGVEFQTILWDLS